MIRVDELQHNQQRVVLIADDDDAVLNLVAHVVAGTGLTPLKVSDGAAALEFARTCSNLLLCAILDVQMPLMNGADAAYAIQQIAPDMTIVLMSGFFPAHLAERMQQVRLFAMLDKPFKLNQLRDILTQIVKENSQHRIDTMVLSYTA
jgi:two-component system response regulator AtoC